MSLSIVRIHCGDKFTTVIAVSTTPSSTAPTPDEAAYQGHEEIDSDKRIAFYPSQRIRGPALSSFILSLCMQASPIFKAHAHCYSHWPFGNECSVQSLTNLLRLLVNLLSRT